MSEKTLTRYGRGEFDSDIKPMKDGPLYYVEDVDPILDALAAALAAEREHYSADIADLNEIHREHLAAKDARIAELERERDELKHDMEQAIDGRNSEAQANEALRTAIEAKAAEWADSYVPDGYSEVSDEDYGKRQMCEEHAAELRELLGEGK